MHVHIHLHMYTDTTSEAEEHTTSLSCTSSTYVILGTNHTGGHTFYTEMTGKVRRFIALQLSGIHAAHIICVFSIAVKTWDSKSGL